MNVSLREFRTEDLPLLEGWRKSIGGESYMSNYRPKQEVSAHDPVNGVWWYIIQADGEDVGTVWLERGVEPAQVGLGIFLGQEALFGRGIGAEAITKAVKEVGKHEGIDKIILNVRNGNTRAIACYAKCGFVPISYGVKRSPDGGEIHYATMELRLKP